MLKTVHILGKHNVERLNGDKGKRVSAGSWASIPYLLDPQNHIEIVNHLYLCHGFEGQMEVKRELLSKLCGYKSQDKKKSRDSTIVEYDELLEKMVLSKMKCSYCQSAMKLLYVDVRDPHQWTLDRKDNDLGHSGENTVLSCLKCNLGKRRINDDKFRFTKQMRLIKQK